MSAALSTETEDGSVAFGVIELDLLATHADANLPFPLRVPSTGRIPGERTVLFAAAGQTLRARGLADETGPVGLAAELVAALRGQRGTVDLVLSDAERSIGLVALVHDGWAFVCRQVLSGSPDSTVRVRKVAETALADELLAEVPELAAARSMPVSLPGSAASGAARLVETVEPGELAAKLRELVADNGGDPKALDELVALLPSVTGRGQVGATRDGQRAGDELSWLDSPRGRVRVNHADNGWLSVNPLRHKDIGYALDGLAATARKRG